MPPELTLVLPAFNERESIGPCVSRALEVLPGLVSDFEIVVVDDGSADGTSDVLRPLLDEHHPRLRVLRHERNAGYGAALRTGFAAANGALVFYTDSDNQFDIAELAGLIPLLDEADVAVGFRVYRFDPVIRIFLSWGYNVLVRLLFRVRVHDVDCSFKLFRREVIDSFTLGSTDFFVDTELLARSRKAGFVIVEKGVRHYPRRAGATTVRPSDVPRTLLTVARMWRDIHFGPSRRRRSSAGVTVEELSPTR